MPVDQKRGEFILGGAYGSCDIRGEYGKAVTGDDAYRLGGAIGYWLETEQMPRTVVVGGDYRLSTEALRTALIDGLIHSGCSVYDLGIVPTPAYYYARRVLGTSAGVMITASHNPSHHNGFKPIIGDLPLIGESIDLLWSYVLNQKMGSGNGKVEQANLMNDYLKKVKSFFSEVKNMRVVIDSGNGCYGPYASGIFRSLGYEVVELFSEPDGRFPNRGPDSSVAKNLALLGGKVRETKASFGIAYDGDGDRFGAVDENGEYIRNDLVFALFIRHFLKGQKGVVVYDLKLSDVVPQEVKAAGCTPMMEKTGHAFIKHSFEANNALLAGEYTGHFAFQEIGTDDGLFASLKMAQLVQSLDGSLSEEIGTIPQYTTTPDIRIHLDKETIRKILSKVELELSDEAEIVLLDGVRAQFKDGWGLVRSSIYAPELSIRFEGYTPESLERIIRRFDKVIPEIGLLEKAGIQ